MTFENREGSGALFKNEFKTKDAQPHYKGHALINGIEMEIAAWVKNSSGEKPPFMSLSIKPKTDRPGNSALAVKPEDLPF